MHRHIAFLKRFLKTVKGADIENINKALGLLYEHRKIIFEKEIQEITMEVEKITKDGKTMSEYLDEHSEKSIEIPTEWRTLVHYLYGYLDAPVVFELLKKAVENHPLKYTVKESADV